MRYGLALITAAALVLAAPAGAAPPRHIVQGQGFAVPNQPHASWYLSLDSKRGIEDVRLIGPPRIRASAARPRVVVPSMTPGSYRLLTCSGTRCAASASRIAVADSPSRVQAFGDRRELPPADADLAAERGLRPTICPAPAPVQHVPSYAGALRSAESLLKNAAGAQGMAQFKASGAYRSADAAEAAAFEGVSIGKPGAALAALLRAHDLKPDEPRYLVGAAGLLTSLGHPAEALALIEHADVLGPARSAPMGLNAQAVALNAKGAALIALGQFADAEHYLRAAMAIEPLLAEAKLNLSVALTCAKKDAEGMRFLRAGQWRAPAIAPDGTAGPPPLDQQLDLTHGTQPKMPDFPIPASFYQAAKMVPLYTAMGAEQQTRLTDMSQRHSATYAQMWATYKGNLLSKQRALDIIKFASAPPQFAAQKDDVIKLKSSVHSEVTGIISKLGEDRVGWYHDAAVACASLQIKYPAQYKVCTDREYNSRCQPASETANDRIRDLAATQIKAARDYIAAYYPFATSVLANISDPAFHEQWSITFDEDVDYWYYAPLQYLGNWARWAKDSGCAVQDPGDLPAQPGPPEAPHSEACPPALKGVKLAWKFGSDKAHGIPFDVNVEVNCEKVSLEASGSIEGWVGAFGQLDYSPHSGKVSVFAGPKLSAKIPGTSIGGSFKDGLYMTFTSDEHVADFGFRTSASAAAGFGPFSIKGGDSMDFSFVPVFGLSQ